jgi:hypothetical protein
VEQAIPHLPTNAHCGAQTLGHGWLLGDYITDRTDVTQSGSPLRYCATLKPLAVAAEERTPYRPPPKVFLSVLLLYPPPKMYEPERRLHETTVRKPKRCFSRLRGKVYPMGEVRSLKKGGRRIASRG